MVEDDNLLARAKGHPLVIATEADREAFDHATVSLAEIEVFRIMPELIRKLETAMTRYEVLAGIVDADVLNEAFDVEGERTKYKKFLSPDVDGVPFMNSINVAGYMYESTPDLPYDQCWAWVMRDDALKWRLGISSVDAEMSDDYWKRSDG